MRRRRRGRAFCRGVDARHSSSVDFHSSVLRLSRGIRFQRRPRESLLLGVDGGWGSPCLVTRRSVATGSVLTARRALRCASNIPRPSEGPVRFDLARCWTRCLPEDRPTRGHVAGTHTGSSTGRAMGPSPWIARLPTPYARGDTKLEPMAAGRFGRPVPGRGGRIFMPPATCAGPADLVAPPPAQRVQSASRSPDHLPRAARFWFGTLCSEGPDTILQDGGSPQGCESARGEPARLEPPTGGCSRRSTPTTITARRGATAIRSTRSCATGPRGRALAARPGPCSSADSRAPSGGFELDAPAVDLELQVQVRPVVDRPAVSQPQECFGLSL